MSTSLLQWPLCAFFRAGSSFISALCRLDRDHATRQQIVLYLGYVMLCITGMDWREQLIYLL